MSVPGLTFSHTQPDWQLQQVRKLGSDAKKLLKSMRRIAFTFRLRILRHVLDHAGDLEIARHALGNDGEGPAHDLIGAEAVPRFGLRQDGGLRCWKVRRQPAEG